MERYYPVLRLNRGISYLAGDVAIVAGAILAFRTLRHLGEVPNFWLIIVLALPFVAAIGAKTIGDLFGVWLENEDRSADEAEPARHSGEWE